MKRNSCQDVQGIQKAFGNESHEKKLMGNWKSYDKAPEHFKLEFSMLKKKKSVFENQTATSCWVSDLGQCLILESSAGAREGLSRPGCYAAFISYANPSLCMSQCDCHVNRVNLGRNFCVEKRLLCRTAAYSHNARTWGTKAGRLPRVWGQPRLKTKTQSPKSKKKINAKENLFLIKVCVPGDCQLFFYDSIEGLNGA